MSVPTIAEQDTLDESQISQIRESLASFRESIGSSGQQQDVTMDNSYTMGFRSPSMSALAGQGSPSQGRSLREYEEQMSTLRKENFNLKLRIFFLEEKTGMGVAAGSSAELGHGSPDASKPENLFKQNVDLKVEVASLSKEVQEKQELLCQAAKAMELMEEGQRKAEARHREIIDDMEHRLETLQLEIKQMEAAERTNLSRTKLNETGLLDFLDKMEHREVSVQEKLQSLEMENAVRECHSQNEQLCRRIDELNKQLEEKDRRISALEVELNEMRFECAEMKDKLEENDKSTSDAKIVRLKNTLFETKSDLADKMCMLDEAETKLKDKSAELVKTVKLVEKLLKTMTDQEKEISRLKRNSIISDPGSASNATTALCPGTPQPILDQQQLPVSQQEYDALCQRFKALQTKNDSLIQKLTGGSTDRNENIIIRQLNDELIEAREEAERAQSWRKECAELCAISTARLEELAGFLDSLLKNKEFCGTLSTDRRKAIRKAVDRSLDLSRSLNLSISVTGFSLPENSLANLSCLTGFLEGGDDTFLSGDANKENRALVSQPNRSSVGGSAAKMIECLKAENKELRGQLENRVGTKKGDARKKLMIPLLAEPLSDSEAWSEPDRDVSLARIGLEETSASKAKSGVRSHGGVLQELSSTSENETNVGHMKKQNVELKQLQETVGNLTTALQEKDSKILEVQSRLVDLDNKLQEERMKAARTQAELENTRHVNQRLEKENINQQQSSASYESRLEELTKEIQQKDEFIEKLKKDREQAFVDLRVAVMKLDNLRAEHQEVQQKHKTQIDTMLTQERQRLEELRQDLTESFNSQLQAQRASYDASLTESYISKNIYQEKVKELEELHFRLEDAHMNMVSMAEVESKLRQQMSDMEKSIQSMRKTLDDTTLQASKAALERTKALNEKRLLQDELKHVQCDLETVKCEKNELNAKLVEIQKQLQQNQRSPPKRLNSSSTAEGSTTSGYTSEELHGAERVIKAEGANRLLENSSPDLGIESDAGRLSNNESTTTARSTAGDGTPSPARPLLKTLELTKSMSNLLMDPKEEANQELTSSTTVDGNSSASKPPVVHDCAKIEADYGELKRRYKQTRRHLELAYDSIKSSNKRKEQLERDIKQQIQKTNVVLKTVRTNMTNELEKSPSSGAIAQSEGRLS